MSYRLGVDLGTTYTAAARLDRDAADGSGREPALVALGTRALQIPSVLFRTDDGEFLVGEPAERRGLIEPARLVREFKRRIGDPVPMLVGGAPYSPQSLTARLLRWVVDTTTERLGEPPAELVVTHPANWGPYKLELLEQVVSLAGVGPATLCAEPVAAAAQYAAQNRVAIGDRVAVYDLGGGTFDICVLEKTATGFAVLGTADGVEHLGGVDFDEAIFHLVLDQLPRESLGADLGDPALTSGLARLRRECVEAKEALSGDVEAVVPVALPGVNTSVRVTRSELESLIRPALRETVAATERCIHSAGLEPTDLRSILLVGGSSRIPLVSELLQQAFEVPSTLDTHPKHDVALGAVRTSEDTSGSRAARTAARTGPAGASRWRRRPALVAGATALVAASVVTAVMVQAGPTPSAAPTSLPPPSAVVTSAATAGSTTPSAVPGGLPVGAVPLPDQVVVWSRVRAGTWDIGLADTAAGTEMPALVASPGNDSFPVISPDRRTVVYSRWSQGSPSTLRVVGVDGKGDRPLFRRLPPGCAGLQRPAWSPDGATFVSPCRSRSTPGELRLMLLEADGTVVRELDRGRLGDPTFCAGGATVVYWRNDEGKASGGALYAASVEEDSEPVQLTDGGDGEEADAVCSPSGRTIAFRRGFEGDRKIFLATLTGRGAGLEGRPEPLSEGNDQDPSWSPDGTRIAYKHGPDADADLWVIDVASRRAAQVLVNPEADTAPAWTPR